MRACSPTWTSTSRPTSRRSCRSSRRSSPVTATSRSGPGSPTAPGSSRGTKRELISRCYNALLHVVLGTRFSDAQCGFKAIRADRARELLPLVRDRAWFFDTELLVLAERAGLRIHEVPVDWVDDPDSRVDIVATALDDLRGVVRLARDFGAGRPAAVPQSGFARPGAPLRRDRRPLDARLRGALPGSPAAARRPGRERGRAARDGDREHGRQPPLHLRDPRAARDRLRHQLQGLAVFGLALALTACSLALLHLLDPSPSRALELTVLVAANLVATVLRFVLLRSWVFRARRAAPAVAR